MRTDDPPMRWQKEALEAAVSGAPLGESLSMLARIVTEGRNDEVRTAFYVVNDDATRLHSIPGAGDMPKAYTDAVDGFRIGADSMACGLAIPRGEPILTADVLEDPLWKPWTHLAKAHDFRGCWSFPIKTQADKAVGTFAMYFRRARQPTPDDLACAEVVTQLAAIIMSHEAQSRERARAEAALRETHAELQTRADDTRASLLRQLATAEEAERRRISRDLHDQLGQQVTALGLKLAALRSLRHLTPDVREKVEDLQRIAADLDTAVDFFVWELRPTVLDDLGLNEALADYTKAWSRYSDLPVHYSARGLDGNRLPPETETVLYRIAQEALTNVVKHADATKVDMILERRDHQLSLIVEDDGVGFGDESRNGGLGLVGMRERAALIGGSIEVESRRGAGTTIFVRVPLP